MQQPEITATINQNYAQCVKEMTYWGHTVYNNICNGTVQDIPWGTLDYWAAVFIGVAIVVGIIIGFAVAGMFIRMIFDW